ncbi:MAG TPA: tetratricopeptide repeat protein [Kofleriaceae bacterium]|nr:tetratricopeptide repeat protein [Kofleriaceae bacterium]
MDLESETGNGPIGRPLRRLGRYELMQRLAAGGMAEVYLARLRGPMNFSKALAIKVVHPHLTAQGEFLSMLLDEARLSALIKHPNVVDIYELGHAEGSYFIAMEYIEGQSLTAVIQGAITGEPMDPLAAARIVADAADGLHAAHELRSGSGRLLGLVHRDVSPGNIMVGYDGGVKIVDFGIAKARGRLTVSGVQQFKGKASYVAPEQLRGGVVDRRTDVYSLGVVLWEALTLQRLHRVESEREALEGREMVPPSPSAVRSEVPAEVSEVCLKALRVEPDERFQTAGEMKEALDSVLLARGFYREIGYLPKYMERVFGRQQESRARVVRKIGAYTMTSEMQALGGDVPFDDDEDFPDVSFEEAAAPAPDPATEDLARGTPVQRSRPSEATLAPDAVRRVGAEAAEPVVVRSDGAGRWLLLALLVLAIAGAGGWAAKIYLDRDGAVVEAPAKKQRKKGKARRPEAAAAAPVAPAAEAAPAEAPVPEPAVEAAAEPASKAAALHDEGVALLEQGDGEHAKERFKAALLADPHHAPAYRSLGMVYAGEGRHGKAIKSFERYLELAPDASDADAVKARIGQLER